MLSIMRAVNPKKFSLIVASFVIVVSLVYVSLNSTTSIADFVARNYLTAIFIGIGVSASFFLRSKVYWNIVILILGLILVRAIFIGELHHLWDILLNPQIALLPMLLSVVPFIMITSIKWIVTNHGVVRGWISSFLGWLTTP